MMRVVARCDRVRYLWPFNWVPLWPVLIGWFGYGELGLGMAWLWIRIYVVVQFAERKDPKR